MRINYLLALLAIVGVAMAYAGVAIAAATPASVASSSNVDWAHLTADELASLSDDDFGGMSATDLSAIPAAACDGFKASQIGAIGRDHPTDGVCGGFQSACVEHIDAGAFGGIVSNCLSQIPDSVIPHLTGPQISALSGDACTGFTHNQTAHLTDAKLCGAFTSQCLSKFSLDGVHGLQHTCVATIKASVLGSLSADQIGSLSIDACAGLTSSNTANFGDNCMGFKPDQFEKVSTGVFSNWPVPCVKSFTPHALVGWSRVQLRAMSTTAFNSFSVQQISGLSDAACTGISPKLAKTFPGELCAGFVDHQVASWRDFFTSHVCEQWSTDCMTHLEPNAYGGLTEECAQRLQVWVLSNINAEQIRNIQPATMAAFSEEQLAAWPAVSCVGITGEQMAQIDVAYPQTQCKSLSPACAGNLSSDAGTGLTAQCASHLSTAALAAIQPTTFASIPPAFFVGLSREQVSSLSVEQCRSMSGLDFSELGSAWPRDASHGLNPSCVTELDDEQCSTLQPQFFQQLTGTELLKNVPPHCMTNVPCESAKVLHEDGFAGLNDDASSALNDRYSACYPSDGSNHRLRNILLAVSVAVFLLSIIGCVVASWLKRRRKSGGALDEVLNGYGEGEYHQVP